MNPREGHSATEIKTLLFLVQMVSEIPLAIFAALKLSHAVPG
jgi:hypothetical protein